MFVAQGHRVSFIPGWDCHGLPIELKALEGMSQSERQQLAPVELRNRARRLAESTMVSQRDGFKRWGVMADWDDVYSTMDPK